MLKIVDCGTISFGTKIQTSLCYYRIAPIYDFFIHMTVFLIKKSNLTMIVFFVLSFFPRDVLDEILNLIESVSKGFPTYSCLYCFPCRNM